VPCPCGVRIHRDSRSGLFQSITDALAGGRRFYVLAARPVFLHRAVRDCWAAIRHRDIAFEQGDTFPSAVRLILGISLGSVFQVFTEFCEPVPVAVCLWAAVNYRALSPGFMLSMLTPTCIFAVAGGTLDRLRSGFATGAGD